MMALPGVFKCADASTEAIFNIALIFFEQPTHVEAETTLGLSDESPVHVEGRCNVTQNICLVLQITS